MGAGRSGAGAGQTEQTAGRRGGRGAAARTSWEFRPNCFPLPFIFINKSGGRGGNVPSPSGGDYGLKEEGPLTIGISTFSDFFISF